MGRGRQPDQPGHQTPAGTTGQLWYTSPDTSRDFSRDTSRDTGDTSRDTGATASKDTSRDNSRDTTPDTRGTSLYSPSVSSLSLSLLLSKGSILTLTQPMPTNAIEPRSSRVIPPRNPNRHARCRISGFITRR